MNRHDSFTLATAAWATILGLSMLALAKYEVTPGIAATVGDHVLGHDDVMSPNKLTLVVFLHPKCPCSAASIQELAELVRVGGAGVQTRVYMFKPADQPDDWARTSTYRLAASIPAVSLQIDEDGRLAKRWGAQTSGQVFLYGKDGRLLFEGGITGSRGHAGENGSLDRITRIILGQRLVATDAVVTPVFGCQIQVSSPSVKCPTAHETSK